MATLPIYLDYNATTPCDPAVAEVMWPFFTQKFGNAASRSHYYGWQAEEAVDIAREQVAQLIGAEKNEIIFMSGATEAANLAIKGVVEAYASKGNHIITTNIEHKAVLDTCNYLEKRGVDVTYLPVDKDGLIKPEQIELAITPTTILIAIMMANNEIGTVMPIKEMGAIAKMHSVIFFTDATQAVGKIPVDVNSDNIDLLALSAHKIYGPKGAGALYIRRRNPRVKVAAQIHGGGHEKNIRSGTLNVPGIVGLGAACSLVSEKLVSEKERISLLRDKLETALLQLEEVYVNGSKESRLPNVSNLSFRFIEGDALLMAVNKTIAVSSGSACTSASLEPSYVLKALGLADELAFSSIRFSLGRFTTETEIDTVIVQVTEAVKNLRSLNPQWRWFKEKADTQ